MDILYFPSNSGSNQYLKNMRLIWESRGFNVYPLRNRLISNPFERKNRVVIFNWLEDMPSGSQYPFLSFVICFIIFCISKVISNRVFFVKHNYKPHRNSDNIYSKCLTFLLSHFCYKKISHRETDGFCYIEHPTYPVAINIKGLSERKYDFGFYGKIGKYKGIPEVLDIWPEDTRLNIFGECVDDELDQIIRDKIQERKLMVTYKNIPIDDDMMNELLNSTKTVIISHKSNTSLVSGMFYHAASLGCNVLIKDSDYSRYNECKFSFSFTLKDRIEKNTIEPHLIINEINSLCSNEVLGKKWESIIRSGSL